MQEAKLSRLRSEFDAVSQNISTRLDQTQHALQFLENPTFADVPLADMQTGLRQTLGYTQYQKLGIATITDKQALVTFLTEYVADYRNQLSEAKRRYEKAVDDAVLACQELQKEADEKVRATLKRVKCLGLDKWDLNFLLAQISAGLFVPDL